MSPCPRRLLRQFQRFVLHGDWDQVQHLGVLSQGGRTNLGITPCSRDDHEGCWVPFDRSQAYGIVAQWMRHIHQSLPIASDRFETQVAIPEFGRDSAQVHAVLPNGMQTHIPVQDGLRHIGDRPGILPDGSLADGFGPELLRDQSDGRPVEVDGSQAYLLAHPMLGNIFDCRRMMEDRRKADFMGAEPFWYGLQESSITLRYESTHVFRYELLWNKIESSRGGRHGG